MPHEQPETFWDQIRIIKRLKKAMEEIIESEEAQSIRSYGLGDRAREALRHSDQAEAQCPGENEKP